MHKEDNHDVVRPFAGECLLEPQVQLHTRLSEGIESQAPNPDSLVLIEFAIKQLDASDPPESTPTAPPRNPKKKTPVKYWL